MNLLKKRENVAFYDKWEQEPQETREKVIRSRLEDYIGLALSTAGSFYQPRIGKINFSDNQPLKNVPIMKSQDLRELLPPKNNILNGKRTTDFTVFQSGGTTGAPKTTLFSNEELDNLTLPNARGFFALGLTENDKVANLFAAGGLYMTFIHINRMLQEYGCMNFPFSNHTPADFVHAVARLFEINCFAGITSVVLDCLRKFPELGLDGIKIEKVFFGGEHIYEADREELQKKLGVKLIAAPGYGTVDTWYIGYQCLHCPPGVFHAHDDQTYIELIDEETGAACPPGKAGTMLATPFPRRITPVVRYLVGDRAQWLENKCQCGRTTPLFKLLGRGDDVLRIGFDSIDYNFIQDAALHINGLSGTIQMEKRRISGKDQFIIRVESEAHVDKHVALAKELSEKILSLRPSLKSFIEKGTVFPIEIEILPLAAIPRNSRTGKLTRVIDSIE
ncbi:MAG: hypothetical protein HQM10_24215 [Candidatus Riflebacteria bacterium]|nr:hypothetical protein [Candidatus Riflebacteria bacterium]